ncbi:hypothetical protein LSH36_660g02023 [Paralvinella palmiformis]|uniref:Uncharacterized protein n=1 Tax=Paralvinella palmiformis TaxID=53620 RepID=A0AAD9J379_9ANNE|nr:hypothetical protein LSH36_660g02023 [Paralvinella palmiformis]
MSVQFMLWWYEAFTGKAKLTVIKKLQPEYYRQNHVHVCMAFDENDIVGAIAAINSIQQNSRRPVYFHLVTDAETQPILSSLAHLWGMVPHCISSLAHLWGMVPRCISSLAHLWGMVPCCISSLAHLWDMVPCCISSLAHLWGMVPRCISSLAHLRGMVPHCISSLAHLWGMVPRCISSLAHLWGMVPLHQFSDSLVGYGTGLHQFSGSLVGYGTALHQFSGSLVGYGTLLHQFSGSLVGYGTVLHQFSGSLVGYGTALHQFSGSLESSWIEGTTLKTITYDIGILNSHVLDGMVKVRGVREELANVGINMKANLGIEFVPMQLDTGTTLFIIPEGTYRSVLSKYPLQASNITLKSYTGDAIPIAEKVYIPVMYRKQRFTLTVVVVCGEQPALLGRD